MTERDVIGPVGSNCIRDRTIRSLCTQQISEKMTALILLYQIARFISIVESKQERERIRMGKKKNENFFFQMNSGIKEALEKKADIS